MAAVARRTRKIPATTPLIFFQICRMLGGRAVGGRDPGFAGSAKSESRSRKACLWVGGGLGEKVRDGGDGLLGLLRAGAVVLPPHGQLRHRDGRRPGFATRGRSRPPSLSPPIGALLFQDAKKSCNNPLEFFPNMSYVGWAGGGRAGPRFCENVKSESKSRKLCLGAGVV